MTDPTGFPALGPNALADVRATDGRLQIGLGLALVALGRLGRTSPRAA